MNEFHSTDFLGVVETGSSSVKDHRDVLTLLRTPEKQTWEQGRD